MRACVRAGCIAEPASSSRCRCTRPRRASSARRTRHGLTGDRRPAKTVSQRQQRQQRRQRLATTRDMQRLATTRDTQSQQSLAKSRKSAPQLIVARPCARSTRRRTKDLSVPRRVAQRQPRPDTPDTPAAQPETEARPRREDLQREHAGAELLRCAVLHKHGYGYLDSRGASRRGPRSRSRSDEEDQRRSAKPAYVGPVCTHVCISLHSAYYLGGRARSICERPRIAVCARRAGRGESRLRCIPLCEMRV